MIKKNVTVLRFNAVIYNKQEKVAYWEQGKGVILLSECWCEIPFTSVSVTF